MKCNVCIGIAIGMIAGMIVATVPSVQRISNDVRKLVERDVVDPVKDFMRDKKRKASKEMDD